jgi:hypothetical protein
MSPNKSSVSAPVVSICWARSLCLQQIAGSSPLRFEVRRSPLRNALESDKSSIVRGSALSISSHERFSIPTSSAARHARSAISCRRLVVPHATFGLAGIEAAQRPSSSRWHIACTFRHVGSLARPHFSAPCCPTRALREMLHRRSRQSTSPLEKDRSHGRSRH